MSKDEATHMKVLSFFLFFAGTQIGKAAALKLEEGDFIYFRALPFYLKKKLASNSISFSPFSITAWWVFLIYGQFSDFCPRVCFEALSRLPLAPRAFTCINLWILFSSGRLKWQALSLSRAQTRKKKLSSKKVAQNDFVRMRALKLEFPSIFCLELFCVITEREKKEKLN